MIKQFLTVAAAALAMSGCSEAPAPEEQSLAETIMAWWPGDYDNSAQIDALVASGEPVWRADGSGEGGHIEVTSHYRAVELPAFGPNVLYVEETKHGDPSSMFRQRIYTVSENADGEVRVKLWYFKDKEAYVGAFADTARLASLTPEDMSPLQDGCDLVARWDEGKIQMPMEDGACVFGDRGFNYQVLLGADSFWFRDKITDAKSGDVLETAGNFTYHTLAPLGS